MSEKSYVSMAVCQICGKETGEILLDRRLKESMEKYTPAGVCKSRTNAGLV